MKQKDKNDGFLRMLLGTLGASLLGNPLTSKGIKAKMSGSKANIPGQGI